jgi:hypothetical protein
VLSLTKQTQSQGVLAQLVPQAQNLTMGYTQSTGVPPQQRLLQWFREGEELC